MPYEINLIFNYKTNDYQEVPHSTEDSCESICIYLCKKLNILPPTRLLFGLRIADTEYWLPPCDKLKSDVKYDLRIRFKVPQLTTLKKIDEVAYDYYYHQVRHDLVNDRIPEIKYPAYKDSVLGLGVVDMYIDMIERNVDVPQLEKHYKKYIPKELSKNHFYFAKKIVHKGLRDIKKKDHDLFYVKGTYLESINTMAPNYLIEQFSGTADYLPEDELQSGTCPVTIEFNPFHTEQPGLRVYYNYKKEWKHIMRIENIYAMYRIGNGVRFEISDLPNGFRLFFSRKPELESFITYVAGYYRLTCKWILDLCVDYITPSLQELKEQKYHGPIGGEFSYAKIREKRNKPGSYIVRQCEKNYDTYFVDINTKGTQTETFKITKECNQWHLHMQECVRIFHRLTELVLSIKTTSQHFRIPPSEYDKPPLLLICLPRNQITTKKTVSKLSEAELQRNRGQIIDPKIDLQWYKNSQVICEGGRMKTMRADWILSDDKRLDVTLKILTSERDFREFMELANRWSKMYAPEFIKLYGLTLSTPHTLVLEHSHEGSLNKFLRLKDQQVSLFCLLEAVHALVRAIVYLKENNIIHAFIRCSYLYVIKFNPKTNTLVVKLGDPGFNRLYKNEDFPWIPIEYYDTPEEAKRDITAESWAFATTVWEIFSRGAPIKESKETLRSNYNAKKRILPIPCNECPQEIIDIISDGWNPDPDKRFCQQSIFSCLACIQSSSSTYSNLTQNTDETELDNGSIHSKESDVSGYTDETIVNGNDSDKSSNYSGSSSIQEEVIPFERQPRYATNYFEETPSIIQTPIGKIIFIEKIGNGHYGTVFRGEYHYFDKKLQSEQIAIKTLKGRTNMTSTAQEDFLREIKIMSELDHPNIIKILTSVAKPQISIIMEYVECKSFIDYLSSNKPHLTNEKLLKFAHDIASGMDYLGKMKVIHRDLAARNILVDNEHVKISDFGLAQFADSDGYYFVKTDREIPIKWYAPETIKRNKFSFSSDVWSFGVTLFEMFSRGEKPNLIPDVELDGVELLDRLERGERLAKPIMCPDNVYDEIIFPCWYAEPKNRPNFKVLLNRIQVILDEIGEFI